jgi:hypothetical protein
MTELEQLQAQLAEARAAEHKLLTQKQAVSVNAAIGGQNGVTFKLPDAPLLREYIVRLEGQIRLLKGELRSRPVYM